MRKKTEKMAFAKQQDLPHPGRPCVLYKVIQLKTIINSELHEFNKLYQSLLKLNHTRHIINFIHFENDFNYPFYKLVEYHV